MAGATSTATHGTGLQFGNLSSRIVGLRIVAGDGSVVEATPERNADVLDVARVGVGALGILSVVTHPVRARVQPARPRAGRAGRRGARAVGGGDHRPRPLRVLLDPQHQVGAHQAQPPHGRADRAAAVAVVPRRLPAHQPGVRPDLPGRPRRSPSRQAGGQAGPRHRTGRVHRRQLQGVRQRPAREVLRDGVRHPQRAPRRGAQPRARPGPPPGGADLLPGGGPGGGRRRHPAEHGVRTHHGLHRGARLPGHRVRPVLPGGAGDHGRLRRPAPLGEDALPDRGHAGPAYPRGTSSSSAGPARPRRPVHQPVPRSRPRAGRAETRG